MKVHRILAIGSLALLVAACGDDGSSLGESTTDDATLDGTAGESTGDEDETPVAAPTDGTGDGSAPAAGTAGSGSVTIGATTWDVEGTCNSPFEDVVLLTGTAVDDASVEIYVTATPGAPDTASAYVTDGAGAFDWGAGEAFTQFGGTLPETSWEGGVGRGSATFVDTAQPTLDPVLAEGSWEFTC